MTKRVGGGETSHALLTRRSPYVYTQPASLPMLGAAGVVVVGMTAWIMAGKGVHLGGGSGPFGGGGGGAGGAGGWI